MQMIEKVAFLGAGGRRAYRSAMKTKSLTKGMTTEKRRELLTFLAKSQKEHKRKRLKSTLIGGGIGAAAGAGGAYALARRKRKKEEAAA